MRVLPLWACAGMALAGCDAGLSVNAPPAAEVVRVCRAAIDSIAGAEAGADVRKVSATAARLSYAGDAKSMGPECLLQDGRVLFPAASTSVAGPPPPKEIRYRVNGPRVALEIMHADGSRSTSTSVTTEGKFDARMSIGDGGGAASGEEQ